MNSELRQARESVNSEVRPRRAFFACTNCLRELESFSLPCTCCGSRKIEHVEFLRLVRGEHWRELIQAKAGPVN